MTEPKPELTKVERDRLTAEWAYLIARIREVAEKLGYDNPFPAREERRKGLRIDQSDT